MVIQRNRKIIIWGKATPRTKITVQLGNKQASVMVSTNGNWSVSLPSFPSGGPYQLKIIGLCPVTIKNVLLGDVWLCAGQSNMLMSLSEAEYTESDILHANYPMVRFFETQVSRDNKPAENSIGCWLKTNTKYASRFSAVGYHFAREVYSKTMIPIGIIQCAALGSGIEPWMNSESIGLSLRHPVPEQASSLFNGMISPITKFGIKGVIWYQGEGDIFDAAKYKKLFPKLIQSWRKSWGDDTIPFLYVQLPNFSKPCDSPTESAWAEFREAQLFVSNIVPGAHMVTSIDTGGSDIVDLHPKHKREIGHRLALTALAITYNKQVPFQSPFYRSMDIVGNKIRISFASAGDGIVYKGSKIEGFSVAGADRKFHWADAKIDETKQVIYVWSPEVSSPVAARYGWADNPKSNLYSATGLPVIPFRTDNWQSCSTSIPTRDFYADLSNPKRTLKHEGRPPSYWLAKAYLTGSAPPDIVVLGDSQLGPLLGADSYVYDRVVDVAGDRRSHTTEHDLELLLHKHWRVFIAGLSDAMISDQLVISRALFSETFKPRLVVVALAPREFIDDTCPPLTKTESFSSFAKLARLGSDLNLFCPDYRSQINWQHKSCITVTNKLKNAFEQRNPDKQNRSADLPQDALTLGQPFQNIRPGEMVIGSGDGYQFKDNTDEYKKKYRKPDSLQLRMQLRCLEALFKYLGKQKIATIAIELPLTNINRMLLPEGFWKFYHKTIKGICKKNDVDYWDTQSTWDDFSANEFCDSAHLGLRGGLKLTRPIVLATAYKFHFPMYKYNGNFGPLVPGKEKIYFQRSW